jgi:hypothetical protein
MVWQAYDFSFSLKVIALVLVEKMFQWGMLEKKLDNPHGLFKLKYFR